MYKSIIKPYFDFLAAFIGLLLLSPIFILLMIFLTISNNGQPFFFQKRPGRNEMIFKIIKFKTMNDRKDGNGYLLSDAERLTGIGKFVRRTSFDEIPQLLNVIKGDMSLVGPRPLLPEYLPLYNQEQKKRHQVKPGITGWAQVNGRNAISWHEKFKYDIKYVEQISLALDLKILYLTFRKVFKGDGISQANQATAEKFKGNL